MTSSPAEINSTNQTDNIYDDSIEKEVSADTIAVKSVPDLTEETMLQRMGGWRGIVASTLPVVVFVPVNAIWGLITAIGGAVGTALLILLIRLSTHQKITPAISGFLGVALCGLIAYKMGDAKGYYLWGIWGSLVYAIVLFLTIIIKKPMLGLLWNALNSTGQEWHTIPAARRYYSYATWIWIGVFALRFGIQQWMYYDSTATALGIVRIGMGWPLTIIALIPTVWLMRKAIHATSSSPTFSTPTDIPAKDLD